MRIATLLFLTLASAVFAQQPPALLPRMDIALPTARWALLPDAVSSARRAQDGRLWLYIRGGQSGKNTLEQIKQLVEREWPSDMPQLSLGQIVGFEPRGRVWLSYWYSNEFRPEGQSALLGYDGRNWVQKIRAGRAAWAERTQGFAAAAGCVFFSGPDGVDVFDGQGWLTPDLSAAGGKSGPGAVLAAEPDGLGALAAVPCTGPGGTIHGLWRYRNGAWNRLVGLPEDPRIVPRYLVPGPRGAWVLVHDMHPSGGYQIGVRVLYVSYTALPGMPLDQLISQLKAADVKARDAATDELISRGDAALKAVTAALAGAQEDESRFRLEYVRHRLQSLATPGGATTVGAFEITSPRYLITAADGRSYLSAQYAAGALRGQQVVLVCDRAGTWSELSSGDAATRFFHGLGGTLVQEPIPVDGGKRLWVHNGYGPARMLDPATRQVVAAFPITGGERLVGPGPKGQMLVVQGATAARCYTPGAEDPRLPLTAHPALQIAGGSYGVAPDGTVWAGDATTPLTRFDGKAWRSDPRWEKICPTGLVLAGRGGVVLVESGGGWHLVTPENLWSEPNLETLLAAQHKEITAAFAGPRPGRLPSGDGVYLVAEPGGVLWLSDARRREFRVYRRGAWSDAVVLRSKTTGHERPAPALAAVGTNHVLAYYPRYSSTPEVAQLVHLTDEGPKFEKLPRPAGAVARTLYDAQGGLWFDALDPARRNSTLSLRLTSEGISQRLPDAIPVALDDADQLWVRPVPRNSQTPTVGVVHAGGMEPVADIPASYRRYLPAGKLRMAVAHDMGVTLFTAAAATPARYTAGPLCRWPYDLEPLHCDPLPNGRAVLFGPRLDMSANVLQVITLNSER